MTVYEMGSKMPTSEFHDWLAFYANRAEERKRAEKPQSNNLLALNPEDLARAFTA
jgi:hypothetical protein